MTRLSAVVLGTETVFLSVWLGVIEVVRLVLSLGYYCQRVVSEYIMAFHQPNFNLLANVTTCDVPGVPAIPIGAIRLPNQPCALVYGKRSANSSSGGTTLPGIPVETINVLFPKGTDVRGPQDTVSFDMIECPAGTGRWYMCVFLDDIGKGYLNEHRTASVFALQGSWLAPYP